MGWFDEQIKTRKLSDQEVVEDSFMKLASSVLGHKAGIRIQSQRYLSKAAIDDILKYYQNNLNSKKNIKKHQVSMSTMKHL